MKPLENTQLPRREREMARHRVEVLEAAEHLLVQQSYSSITVQSIADEAEFSVGYLYKLFPGKDDLYLSLIEARKTEIHELLLGVLDRTDTFTEGLIQLVHGLESWLQEHEGFARDKRGDLMVLFRRFKKHEKAIAQKERLMMQSLRSLFEKGIEEGIVAGAEPVAMAITLRNLIWGFLADDFPSEKEVWTNHAELIVQIILRTYSPCWNEHD